MSRKNDKPPHSENTRTEMLELTPAILKTWGKPGFQRELKINMKVEALSEQIKTDKVLPGILTIGILKPTGERFIVDGQHRCKAFELSGVPSVFCDVRYFYANDMAEMGLEFVRLNSSLVRMTSDSILKGMQGTSEALEYLKLKCKFVGYDNIRRSARGPILSMSTLLRSWFGSANEHPHGGGLSAMAIAQTFTLEEAKKVADFIVTAEDAWGREPEYARLYGGLNLVLTMWLYRRTVLEPASTSVAITPEEFGKCLAALASNTKYLDLLFGRTLTEHHRGPTYVRIKEIFATRLRALRNVRKVSLPDPEWAAPTRRLAG